MSDQDIPTSGSRWEHGSAPAEPGSVPSLGERPTRGGRLPRSLRRRSALALARVGLVLAGGLGGFAVGHAIADQDVTEQGTGTDADQDSTPDGAPDGRGARPGFDRGGPGAPSDGTQDDGSAPGAPSGADGGGTA